MPNDNYANEPNQSRSEDIIQSIIDNTEYDEPARSRIEYLLKELKKVIEDWIKGGIHLVGETSTALVDNATTNPITIDGESYTAQPNDAVIYGHKEFLFDGTKWHEYGDLTGLSSKDIGAMTNYVKAVTASDIDPTDTLNQAIGKLEKRVSDNKNNISKQQNTTASGGNGYAIINGQRLYMGAAQMPERTGDIWIDGATVRESGYLMTENPLCAVDTLKDTLNLATGLLTRAIKKRVLDGTEDWSRVSSGNTTYFTFNVNDSQSIYCVCSHFEYYAITAENTNVGARLSGASQAVRIRPDNVANTDVTAFKAWLAQEHSNGTPVTIWYQLASPTTETITVPSGNTGTVEGYLTQSSTPSQSAPVYPTVNEVPVFDNAFTPEQEAALNSGITSADVTQIGTNKNNILSEQAKTTGMTEGGSNYITVGGIRVYVSATAPTGTIPDGSIWIGG